MMDSVFEAFGSVSEILFRTLIFGFASELLNVFAGEDLNSDERTEVRSTFGVDVESEIRFLGPSDVLRGPRASGREPRMEDLRTSRPSILESRSRVGLTGGRVVRVTGESVAPSDERVSFFRGVVLVVRGPLRGPRESGLGERLSLRNPPALGRPVGLRSRLPKPVLRGLGLRSVLGDGDDNVSLFFGPVFEVVLGSLLLLFCKGDDFVKGN